MISKAIFRMRERLKDARAYKDGAVADLAYGLRLLLLRESGLPSGRVQMIRDLQARAEAVESTLDPAALRAFLDALDAFLASELKAAGKTPAPTAGAQRVAPPSKYSPTPNATRLRDFAPTPRREALFPATRRFNEALDPLHRMRRAADLRRRGVGIGRIFEHLLSN